MSKPYKLKLTKLAWLSSVDAPAQGDGGRALLLKRDTGEFNLTARVSKMDDGLGLVFGHAFAASLDGGKTPHVDYQNDAIDPDFLKTAMEFIEAGGATDVNHDGASDGRIVFAWPLIPEVNDALGIKSDVVGLAVAVKPSPETYKRFKDGELTGFSIAGMGEREPMKKRNPDEESAADASARLKSTQAPAIEQRALTKEEPMATEQDKTIADLTAKLAKAERLATLTDAQRAHYSKLGADGETYLAKSFADRQAALDEIEKANEVVYTSKSTGETFRKSDDARLVTMAKRQDAQAEEIAKRDEAIAKAAVRKQATDVLGGMPGADEVHDLIIGSLLKSGAKQEEIDAAIATLKGMKASSTIGKSAPGVSPGADATPGDSDVALKAFEKGLVTFAKTNNIPNVWTDARAAFVQTTEGAALKRAYDDSLNAG